MPSAAAHSEPDGIAPATAAPKAPVLEAGAPNAPNSTRTTPAAPASGKDVSSPSAAEPADTDSSAPAKPLEEGNYIVELNRDVASDRWGFVWDSQALEKRSQRILQKISPGTLASKWNSTHSSAPMRAGDMLVGVNGKAGRLELLTVELCRNHIICEFKRGSASSVTSSAPKGMPALSSGAALARGAKLPPLRGG